MRSQAYGTPTANVMRSPLGSGASPELLEKLAAELEASYKEPIKWEDPWVYRPTEEYVPDRVEVDPIPECLKELFDEAKNPCDMPSAY